MGCALKLAKTSLSFLMLLLQGFSHSKEGNRHSSFSPPALENLLKNLHTRRNLKLLHFTDICIWPSLHICIVRLNFLSWFLVILTWCLCTCLYQADWQMLTWTCGRTQRCKCNKSLEQQPHLLKPSQALLELKSWNQILEQTLLQECSRSTIDSA